MKKVLLIGSIIMVMFSLVSSPVAAENAKKINSQDSKFPDFVEASKETGMPIKVLKERWEKYGDKEGEVVSDKGEESASPATTDVFSILASYNRDWSNSYKDTSIWICDYAVSARSTASMALKEIQARTRLYDRNGVLRASDSSSESYSTFASSNTEGNIAIPTGWSCKGTAYANNVWEHPGYETAYHESKFNIDEFM